MFCDLWRNQGDSVTEGLDVTNYVWLFQLFADGVKRSLEVFGFNAGLESLLKNANLRFEIRITG